MSVLTSDEKKKRSSDGKQPDAKNGRVADQWGVVEVKPPSPETALGDPLIFDEDAKEPTPKYLFLVCLRTDGDDVPDIWKIKTANMPKLLRALVRASLEGNHLGDSLDGNGAMRRWLLVGTSLSAPDVDGIDQELPIQDGRVIDITGAYDTIKNKVHHTFEMNGWVVMTRID